MILEITEFDLKPGHSEDFEGAVAACEHLFQRARGWHALALHKSREVADRYYLLVTWESVENHTIDFWQSEDFQAWRAHVADCFLRKPAVQHTDLRVSMSRPGLKTAEADGKSPLQSLSATAELRDAVSPGAND